MPKKIASLRLFRPRLLGVAGLILLSGLPPTAGAQSDSPVHVDHYWGRFALGFAGSILAHETAHGLTMASFGRRFIATVEDGIAFAAPRKTSRPINRHKASDYG